MAGAGVPQQALTIDTDIGADAPPDRAGAPAETRGPGPERAGVAPHRRPVRGDEPLPRPPPAVWLAVLLFALVGSLWAVAVPAYRAPDEAAHVDLVLYLAEGHGYPAYDRRFFGEEIGLDTDRHLIDLTVPWPRFDAADAPARRRPAGRRRPRRHRARRGGPARRSAAGRLPLRLQPDAPAPARLLRGDGDGAPGRAVAAAGRRAAAAGAGAGAAPAAQRAARRPAAAAGLGDDRPDRRRRRGPRRWRPCCVSACPSSATSAPR